MIDKSFALGALFGIGITLFSIGFGAFVAWIVKMLVERSTKHEGEEIGR